MGDVFDPKKAHKGKTKKPCLPTKEVAKSVEKQFRRSPSYDKAMRGK